MTDKHIREEFKDVRNKIAGHSFITNVCVIVFSVFILNGVSSINARNQLAKSFESAYSTTWNYQTFVKLNQSHE